MSYIRSDSGALAVLLVGEFMTALDVSIVNVAIPTIGRGLDAVGSTLLLISAGYTLAYATLLVAGARLGDDNGHRKVFLTGLAVFTVASLACGLAPNGPTLVLARVVQGAAGAMIVPQVLSIIQLRFTGHRRGRALGWYAVTISVGAVAGQLLGGVLTGADLFGLSWRAVFLVNVPVGVVLVLATPRLVPATRAEAPRPLDRRGTVLLSAAVLALVLPAALGREQGWPIWTWVVLGAGVLLAAATVAHLRAAPPGRAIFDPRVLRYPGVCTGFLSLFASMATYGALLFCLGLLLQDGLAYSPTLSGLAIIPYIVGFAVTSLLAGRLAGQALRAAVVGGLVTMAIGYLTTGLLTALRTWHPVAASAALLLAGAGMGFGFGPVLSAVISRLPSAHAGDASGALNTISQIGYLTGVSVLGSWYLGSAHLPSAITAARAFTHLGIALAVLALAAASLAVAATRPHTVTTPTTADHRSAGT